MFIHIIKIIFVSLISISASFSVAAELSQADLNEAAMRQFTQSEARLEVSLLRLTKELSPDRQILLQSSQTAWEAYRDANARVSSSAYKGGTISSLIHSKALIEMNERRISELTKMNISELRP